MEELSIEVVFNQSIGQKSPNCQRENFDLNAAYKISETMKLFLDLNTKLYTSDSFPHQAQGSPGNSLKAHIEKGLYTMNRMREFKLTKDLSNYIQIVEQAGPLS